MCTVIPLGGASAGAPRRRAPKRRRAAPTEVDVLRAEVQRRLAAGEYLAVVCWLAEGALEGGERSPMALRTDSDWEVQLAARAAQAMVVFYRALAGGEDGVEQYFRLHSELEWVAYDAADEFALSLLLQVDGALFDRVVSMVQVRLGRRSAEALERLAQGVDGLLALAEGQGDCAHALLALRAQVARAIENQARLAQRRQDAAARCRAPRGGRRS